MKFVEPLGVYFGDVAKDATLNGAAIRVIYDDAYQSGLSMMEGLNPQVHVKEADVVGVKHGDVLVIQATSGSKSYTVREVQPDVEGLVVLQLRANP